MATVGAMLHVTNGDSTVHSIRDAGFPGDVIAWRDTLHEGPVPSGLTLEQLSDGRARFLAEQGFGAYADIANAFWRRDTALRQATEIVLWFEHDLYDQLQLVQILATLAERTRVRVELIGIDRFPGIARFVGLGQLTAAQLASLWPQRKPVTAEQFALAQRAWDAFCAAEPSALRAFLKEDLTPLPFLHAALVRLLEEYPTSPTGLSRNERQLLQAIAAGSKDFASVWRETQAKEAAPYLGDTVLRWQLEQLIRARNPLVTPEPYALTDAGRQVLAGQADHRQLNGIDRWIGGVRLHDSE